MGGQARGGGSSGAMVKSAVNASGSRGSSAESAAATIASQAAGSESATEQRIIDPQALRPAGPGQASSVF